MAPRPARPRAGRPSPISRLRTRRGRSRRPSGRGVCSHTCSATGEASARRRRANRRPAAGGWSRSAARRAATTSACSPSERPADVDVVEDHVRRRREAVVAHHVVAARSCVPPRPMRISRSSVSDLAEDLAWRTSPRQNTQLALPVDAVAEQARRRHREPAVQREARASRAGIAEVRRASSVRAERVLEAAGRRAGPPKNVRNGSQPCRHREARRRQAGRRDPGRRARRRWSPGRGRARDRRPPRARSRPSAGGRTRTPRSLPSARSTSSAPSSCSTRPVRRRSASRDGGTP